MAKNRKFRKQSNKRQTKDKIKSRTCHLNSKTLKQSQRSKKTEGPSQFGQKVRN